MNETIKIANIPEIPGRKEHEHAIDPVAAIIHAARITYTIDNKLDKDQYCAYLNEVIRSKRRTAGILRSDSDSMGEGYIVLAESVERECQKLAKEIRNIENQKYTERTLKQC